MRKQHDEKGAAAVELALVLPFLLALLFGMVDFGLAYHAKITLNQAVREGVRTMAITKNAPQAETATRNAAVGLTNPGALTVDPPTCVVGGDASLTAHYSHSYVSPVSAIVSLMTLGTKTLPNPLPMQATGVMRCGG